MKKLALYAIAIALLVLPQACVTSYAQSQLTDSGSTDTVLKIIGAILAGGGTQAVLVSVVTWALIKGYGFITSGDKLDLQIKYKGRIHTIILNDDGKPSE